MCIRDRASSEPLPRTLLIIDEFQEFFSEDDKLAQDAGLLLSLIHISEPTRLLSISYAVFCLKKKKNNKKTSQHSSEVTTQQAAQH